MAWNRSLHRAAVLYHLLYVLLGGLSLQSHAFTLFSSRHPTTQTPETLIGICVNDESRLLDSYTIRLMMVRGGDDYDEEDDLTEDYSDTDSEDVETVSEQSQPSERDIEIAQRQIALSSQSRNFGIATALWSSLFFDSILNKAKRQTLFPIVEGTPTINLIPTALLACGYALASCVSFLLWRDFDVRSEMEDESDNGENIKKGDWFLSLSCFSGKENNGEFAPQTRSRLYFHLALFGLLNLGAHAGYYFSDAAPFLGLSAAAINFHNTLAVANALLKESSPADLVKTIFKGPLTLLIGGKDSKGGVDTLTFLFRLSAITFMVRCIPTGRIVASLARGLIAGSDPSSVTSNARQLSLHIASLGRLILAAGVSQVFFASRAESLSMRMRNHPFFAVLSGACSLICFGVGGALLVPSLASGFSASTFLSKSFPFDGVMLTLMGLILGYNSALNGMSALKELKN